jgi:hypothetical protein
MVRSRFAVAVAGGLALASLALGASAGALEEQRGEEAAIKACDQRLCAMLIGKNPKGDDLKCALTKTWTKSKIKEADSQKLSWGYGDARCSVDLDIDRASVIAAMTSDRYKFNVPPHTANCIVENGGKLEKVTAVVAPKIHFKDGKPDKVWVNLQSVEGPASIRFTVQTAAQLADTFGLFHRQMIKSMNKYITRHCPASQSVAAKEQPPKAGGKGKAPSK